MGVQLPRILWVPDYASSTGQEAIELCAMAGLVLDPWQQFVLVNALGERPDGRWAAFEVGVEVPRQNGKGGGLEGRELTGLYLLGERLIIHSAHEFATSLEAFHRMLVLIESCPDLERRVKRVSRSHGEEGIELKGGQRIRYKTRTAGGGRGFSCDCLILDEAMNIPERMHAALLPTLSARPNPQVWYTGSAVDQESMEHGVVFARVRERALAMDDPSLAYFGWSPPINHPSDLTELEAEDPVLWAQANPGLGIRITAEHVAREQRSMDPRTFAVERLGIGDWPDTNDDAKRIFSRDVWESKADRVSSATDPVCFAFDAAPDRSVSSIGMVGRREDGRAHIEIVARERGVNWIPERVEELLAEREHIGVVCDGAGPAGSLLPAFAKLGIVPVTVTANEYAKACGMFFDAVDEEDGVRHLGSRDLAQAVAGARTRPLGDAWAWSRKSSAVDITPLVCCTLGLWGLMAHEAASSPFFFEVIG